MGPRPEVEYLNQSVCYDPGKDGAYVPPSLQQLSSVCLFLIRAVGEFSAQK